MKTLVRTMVVTCGAGLMLTVISVGVHAEPGIHDPRVNARQHHQSERIRQGVKSGELTRHEARGLRENERDIRQLERAYKSNGTLTKGERRDLNHELNETSRDIYRQKHDAQQRP